MTGLRQVIALAGVGNLGKYLCEELLSDDRYDVVVLSRKKSKWLDEREVDVRICDYSEDLVLSILDSTNSSALISFINCPGDMYINIHNAILNACERSQNCKRLIPSEWIGNSEDYPHLPRFYAETREPFRRTLRNSGIQWTLFNGGWLMDYFLRKEKTYMPPIPDEFPIDPNNWRACIRGTGNELQAWTWSRDIAKAVVELLAVRHWDPVTYVAGEWGTFNEAVAKMESFNSCSMQISYKSEEETTRFIKNNQQTEVTRALEVALVEEWMIAGASACPREKTLLQRKKYFPSVTFSNLEALLSQAEKEGFK